MRRPAFEQKEWRLPLRGNKFQSGGFTFIFVRLVKKRGIALLIDCISPQEKLCTTYFHIDTFYCNAENGDVSSADCGDCEAERFTPGKPDCKKWIKFVNAEMGEGY